MRWAESLGSARFSKERKKRTHSRVFNDFTRAFLGATLCVSLSLVLCASSSYLFLSFFLSLFLSFFLPDQRQYIQTLQMVSWFLLTHFGDLPPTPLDRDVVIVFV
jgi:hypothetical protein